MRAGLMRHRLRIEQASDKRNSFGEPMRDWVQVAEVAASIQAMRGSESYTDERPIGVAQWTIRLRENPNIDLDPSMRGIDIDHGTIYEFQNVVRNHVRNEVTITATSGSKLS